MSTLRRTIAWLLVFAQIWTPVLAQTLPISVDQNVAGQKPVVGVANGVPVVNIAPPSAGGVSNNRFTQFNVGPSGVVLNNSGAASQTQVAGQVAGNPMLGNQRATTILNQVTAPNPSQLRGMLEVAGNRANVIVANPAGITCNGCGFLNANRATLTTGKPVIGPDGTLGFDIASGRLAIEGAGLYGANLSQLDLLARTLELNAQVWADRLNVVAGLARVGYDGIDVSALTGAGAGSGTTTGVSIDVAALGGMYANSIRLIGTEAGVGVNIGGNLAALTGTLHVSANGDVKILPSGRMQAATDLSVQSGRDIVNDGTVTAGGALALNAPGSITNSGAMSSAGNASIVARQLDNRGAFTAGLQADGSISPLGALSAQVSGLQNAGTLMAGGNATVTADALGLSGGKFVAGGALTLDATGAVTNRAGAVYGGSVLLRAARLDNTGGKLTSGGALTSRVTGGVDNTGGTLAGAGAVDISGQSVVNTAGGVVSGDSVALRGATGINNQGGSVQANGALRVETAGALNNQGGKLLGGTADIQAASLDNRNGVAQADAKLSVANTDALQNQGGGLYGGTADIKTASLANTDGKVVSGGALDLNATGNIDNTGGTIAAQGQATLNAQTLSNTRGIVAASGLTLKTQGALDNSAGLLQADNALALTAGSLNNRNTLANGIAGAGGTTAGALGLMGQQVTLNTGSVDNQAGRIGAGQDLGVTTGALNNAAGNVSSDANAKLAFSSLANGSGALTAGSSLELVTGNLDNDGKIHAGQDLKITADNLTNRATGELIAGRNTELNIGALLANAGLIDGGYVRIGAGTLLNTGRIYGDRIGIQTPVLTNDANAVIASRGDLDLGVGTLTNREHALIYAGTDLRVGASLDASGKATGQAQSVVNASATIEAERNADISAASIQNLNNHFTSEVVETSRGPKLYYRLENSTELMDGSKLWLCDAVTTACGKDPVTFLEDDSERRLLLPSDKYPESRYGPPFDYVRGVRGKEGRDAPIPPAYLPPTYECGPGGDACQYVPGGPRYKAGDGVWRVFGVAEPVDVPPLVEVKCNINQTCLVSTPERDQALATNQARHKELEGKIYAFNADFNGRLVKNFFYYKVQEVVTESRTVSTDPARIIAGGNASFTGAVTNDKSRIIAGATLSVNGPAVNNLGAEGLRQIERVGSEVRTIAKGGRRKESRSAYRDIVAPERIDLAVASAIGNTAPPATGNQKPGASGIFNPLQPAQLIEFGTPGKFVIRVPTLPPVVPTNALYRVMQAPNAPYLIATDSQFIGSRTVTSSDFLLRQLNQNSGYVLKRLGDGFYEQKLVAEQVMLASGQRFVGDYTDNEAQYKALLNAGADFAGKFGLTIGTALSEDQMRHLTGDIVWLVEQTVTLPDGTQQRVLTPQVYLAVRPGDLRGDGTLIAGRATQINTTGVISNSGTLGARNALVVNAQNVRNSVGSIQAKTVNLTARNDIDNLAGLLKGESVALKAGRDINLMASTQSLASGGVSSTRINGVARIDAGSLNAQAGRDFNAKAAAISATGDAAIQAGRDINLTTSEERYAESYVYGKKNAAQMRTAQEAGTVIDAGGNLALTAGRDVSTRAAQLTSEKQLAIMAQRDVNLLAGEASSATYNETYIKQKGFLSSRSTHTKDSGASTTAQGTQLSGESVSIGSGRDITMTGAQVLASKDIVLDAARDVTVQAGLNTYAEEHYRREKKSGFSVGGMGISYGRSDSKSNRRVDGTTQSDARSLLGTTGGNVILTAGRNASLVGSDIVAGKAAGDVTGRTGNIDIQAQNVAILTGRDTENTHSDYSNKQSSFGVKLVGTPVDTFKNLSNAGSAKAKVQELAHSGATTPGVTLNFSRSKSSGSRDTYSQVSSGSDLSAAGDILIRATGSGARDAAGRAVDGDIALIGSNLRAQGGVVLDAKRDITVAGAQNQYRESSKNDSKRTSISVGSMSLGDMGRAIDGSPNASGVKTFPFGTQTATAGETAAGTWQTASLITGNTVYLNSREGDIRIAGSAIDAVKNVGLSASKGSISFDTGTATRDHTSSHSSKSIGDLSGEVGGDAVGIRKTSGGLTENSKTTSGAGSTIVSRQGDVSIIAKEDLLIRGSDIRAGRDVLLGGQAVTIDGSFDTSVFRDFQKSSQIAVTTSVNSPVIKAVETIDRMRNAAEDTNNGRIQAVAAVAAGLAAKNLYDSVAKNPAQMGGISVNVDVGASSSSQTRSGQSSTASGSAVLAGRDLAIIATGNGAQSNITVSGSNLTAGRNVLLNAQGDILLTAQQNTSSQKSDGKSSNASIGVGFAVGGSQNGFAINVGAGGSTSKGSGQDGTWNNTHVVAGDKLTISSGGDTVLRGAQASAAQIVATVGGNLVIESLQDISNYAARDRSGGVQVSLCIPPLCYGASSVSGNYGQTKINSQYASVTEQTGMWAGDGGFQLNVGKNTGLIGGVIASSDKAVADGKNVLITGTLTSRDIENRATYEGQSVQLGGGLNFGGAEGNGNGGAKGGGTGSGNSAIGTDSQGNVAGGSKATPGSTLPSFDGVSANVPIAMGANGEASSTTKSAISGGTIVIRDEAGQKALTGQTAAEAIAALNRDTKDTLNALDRIFDEKEIRAGFEVTKTLAQETGTFLANRAAEADALKEAMRTENDPARYADLERQFNAAKEWLPGGTYRQFASAVLAGLGSNVTGAATDIAQNALVNYLQQQGAAQVGKWVSEGLVRNGSPEHAALQAIVGCAGAAASGQSCGAGATGGAAAILVNALLDSTSGNTNAEKEARRNLVASLIAGAAAVAGADGIATITNAAIAELDNNTLNLAHDQDLIGRLSQIDKLDPKQQDDLMQQIKAAHAAGTQAALDQMKSIFGPGELQETRDQLESMLGSGSACGQVPACAFQLTKSIKELDGLLAQYKTQSELTPKVDAALMVFDIATSGILGVIRNSAIDIIRLSATRAAGGSLEMTVAKMAYTDGASWTVRNAELLAADGTLLARQNPITGKYEAVRPNILIGVERAGTVWDAVKATQATYPGSVIPKSFEMSLSNGQTVWVHGNATEHLAEFAQMKAINSTPEAVRLSSQQQLSSLQAAVNTATKKGVPYDKIINIDGWELKFSPAREPGGLPALIHALPRK